MRLCDVVGLVVLEEGLKLEEGFQFYFIICIYDWLGKYMK